MYSYEQKLNVVYPTLDLIARPPVEFADRTLLNPTNASALIEGELVQPDSTGKYGRATSATMHAFIFWDERGAGHMQATGRATILMHNGMIVEYPLVHASVTAVGTALGLSNFTLDAVTRAGLSTYSSGVRLGFLHKLASANGGIPQIFWTAC